MQGITISAEWSEKERSRVIISLTNRMVEEAKKNVSTPSLDVSRWATTIAHVKMMPSWFLEANRAKILEVAGL